MREFKEGDRVEWDNFHPNRVPPKQTFRGRLVLAQCGQSLVETFSVVSEDDPGFRFLWRPTDAGGLRKVEEKEKGGPEQASPSPVEVETGPLSDGSPPTQVPRDPSTP